MRRRLGLLTLCGLLAAFLCVGAEAADASTAAPDCHAMAEQWFGENVSAELLDAAGAPDGTRTDSPQTAASAYFSLREGGFPGVASLFSESDVNLSDSVRDDLEARSQGIQAFQDALGLLITDADATVFLQGDPVPGPNPGEVVQYAYEWTFYDYDDLSDGIGGSDVSGFGTTHKLTLAETAEGWQVVSDEYDEADLFGVSTVPADESVSADESVPEDGTVSAEGSDSAVLEAQTEQDAALQAFYSGYDPDAAVAYSNQWVKQGANYYSDKTTYNPDYYSYANDGGDCANFTSQALYAGGMPMVYGETYSRNSWFYISANNRSGTWTKAGWLREWMGKNRGVEFVAARNNVFKGNPVFYSPSETVTSHAVLCVGQNSAGTPVINSHTADRYHVVWTYYFGSTYDATRIHTVHLYEVEGYEYGLSITGETKPSGVLQVGSSFSLQGLITSVHILTDVTAQVYDANGVPVMSYSVNPRSTSYNIRTGFNEEFIFDTLPQGGYTYVVTASDSTGETREMIRSVFTVGALPEAPDMPSVTVRGGAVTVSWNAVPYAARYDVYLCADPWTWENIQYAGSTYETSYTFPDVSPNQYAAFVVARPNEDTTQSPLSRRFSVGLASYTLTLNGWLEGAASDTLSNYGTADLYINGELAVPDISRYSGSWDAGTVYEFRNIRPADGFAYQGVHAGVRSGVLEGNTVVTLDFAAIHPEDVTETPEKHVFNGHTYLYYATPLTRYAAAMLCTKAGGHLADVETEEENAFLITLTGGVPVWLGGQETASDGENPGTGGQNPASGGENSGTDGQTPGTGGQNPASGGQNPASDGQATGTDGQNTGTDGQAEILKGWTWTDGQPVAWNNWADGSPDGNGEGCGNYLALDEGGRWTDEAGCAALPFLCELDSAGSVPGTTTEITTASLRRPSGLPEGSVQVTVAAACTQADASLWCAVYDAAGRVLATQRQAMNGAALYTFTVDNVPGAASARLFMLDNLLRPLAASRDAVAIET